ncbi:MAG: hypothetical protein ACRDPC_01140 [Solirubrobacteraceae bacterium]
MKKRRTVSIPADQADRVVDMLIATYAVKAESLAAVAAAYREGGASLADVLDARQELTEAEDALDPLDWRVGRCGHPIVLSAPVGLVRETLYASLTAAAEAVSQACQAYEAGRAESETLAAAVTALATLHRLFAAGEPPEAA